MHFLQLCNLQRLLGISLIYFYIYTKLIQEITLTFKHLFSKLQYYNLQSTMIIGYLYLFVKVRSLNNLLYFHSYDSTPPPHRQPERSHFPLVPKRTMGKSRVTLKRLAQLGQNTLILYRPFVKNIFKFVFSCCLNLGLF